MDRSQRLVFNTLVAYGRSVLSLFLTLFSSRWVLESLGDVDFGLFSLVGSLILIMTFLNTVMANSASRYFAFSIGEGDTTDTTRWFNSALSIHICLAVGLVALGWPLGEYVVAHVLSIPSDRIATSVWIFRTSILSAFISMVCIPFVAMFRAKQQIGELAGWGMLQSTLTFILAYALLRVAGEGGRGGHNRGDSAGDSAGVPGRRDISEDGAPP